jgi:vancomycin resistance protein VanW
MILRNGKITPGVGGGLCQLANMIFWMTAHTPLTVIERHRHGYDVFPDANRTQPFASGATCFYPHVDLMIQNNTNDIFQLCLTVEKDDLVGEWRVYNEPNVKYEVIERNHEMRLEIWGGYTRHNELYKQKFTRDGQFIDEELLVQNSAIMMYSPYLNEPGEQKRYDGSQYNIWDDN